MINQGSWVDSMISGRVCIEFFYVNSTSFSSPSILLILLSYKSNSIKDFIISRPSILVMTFCRKCRIERAVKRSILKALNDLIWECVKSNSYMYSSIYTVYNDRFTVVASGSTSARKSIKKTTIMLDRN